MAQKVEVTITDDLDGSPGAETVQFALEGKEYEIDLNDRNRRIMAEEFGKYIDAGRVAGSSSSGRRRGTRHRTGLSRERSADIRAWAKDQGIKVNERGRIPVAIQAEYDQTH